MTAVLRTVRAQLDLEGILENLERHDSAGADATQPLLRTKHGRWLDSQKAADRDPRSAPKFAARWSSPTSFSTGSKAAQCTSCGYSMASATFEE
jgi:hypothetical protein